MSDVSTEHKTYTEQEVEQMLAQQRIQERTISALITAIQRSVAAGDAEQHTDCLKMLLRQIAGVSPESQKPAEPEQKQPDY